MDSKEQSNASQEQNSKPVPHPDPEFRKMVRKAHKKARETLKKYYPDRDHHKE
jgi:hypothetical protein